MRPPQATYVSPRSRARSIRRRLRRSRRVKGVVAVVAVVLGGLTACSPTAMTKKAEAAADVPNVVVLLIDDATSEDVRSMPHVRRLLADKGVTFTHNYVPMPQCCPARATILTGQYPHNHGVLSNKPPLGGAAAFDDTNTLATYLDPTYETGLAGKYLNGFGTDETAIPPGWDDWRSPVKRTYHYKRQVMNINGQLERLHGYMPVEHAQQTMSFIDDQPEDQPFFAYLGWVAPHGGFPLMEKGRGPYVNKKYLGSYTGRALPKDESFNEKQMADKPAPVRDLPRLEKKDVKRISYELMRRRDSLRAVDDQVAKIVAMIRERGELDDTYFVFGSDNGYMQGQHRIGSGKSVTYEPVAKVPLIIRGPGFPAGERFRGVTGLQDLVPTILDVTDTALPAAAPPPDGVSLLGLVDGSVTTDRPQLLEIAERQGAPDWKADTISDPAPAEADPPKEWLVRGLVTDDRWKYVEYRNGDVELYHLTSDPDELRNLAGEAAHEAQQARLAGLLAEYEACAGHTCR